MTHYFYKTGADAVVAELRAWETKKAQFHAKRILLKQVFGAEGSPMTSGGTHYVGGIELSSDSTLDVHWCKSDEFGYRKLRVAAKPSKGLARDQRTAINAEHKRLTELWNEHCPKSIHSDELWHAVGINAAAVWLSGGISFELDGVGYFALGFEINHDKHRAHELNGGGTNGWIDGAVEIFPREYETARLAKLETAQETSNA